MKNSPIFLVQRNIDRFSAPWYVLSDVEAHAITTYKKGFYFRCLHLKRFVFVVNCKDCKII